MIDHKMAMEKRSIMEKIKIGIPKALLFYKYHTLWKTFLENLDCEVVLSEKTTKETIEIGKKYLDSESCLSMKIFMGHVAGLLGKCDYLLIPRIVSIKKKEKLCTNFSALYDLTHNLFPEQKILYCNIDIDHHETELHAFIQLGKQLKKKKADIIRAYEIGKKEQQQALLRKIKEQKELLKTKKMKILMVGHPYNLYDSEVGGIISRYLKEEDVTVAFADRYFLPRTDLDCKIISDEIYWTYNRELIASLSYYYPYVDGIILLSTFPCGPDSLANEMIIRRKKGKPMILIVMDELTSPAGLETRLESFVDMIKERRLQHETR